MNLFALHQSPAQALSPHVELSRRRNKNADSPSTRDATGPILQRMWRIEMLIAALVRLGRALATTMGFHGLSCTNRRVEERGAGCQNRIGSTQNGFG